MKNAKTPSGQGNLSSKIIIDYYSWRLGGLLDLWLSGNFKIDGNLLPRVYPKLSKLSLETFRRVEGMNERPVLLFVRDQPALVEPDDQHNILCRIYPIDAYIDGLADNFLWTQIVFCL